MTTKKTLFTMENLEKYTNEWTRKHFADMGYRAFRHPNLNGVSIVVYKGKAEGLLANAVLESKAYHNLMRLETHDFLPLDQ